VHEAGGGTARVHSQAQMVDPILDCVTLGIQRPGGGV